MELRTRFVGPAQQGQNTIGVADRKLGGLSQTYPENPTYSKTQTLTLTLARSWRGFDSRSPDKPDFLRPGTVSGSYPCKSLKVRLHIYIFVAGQKLCR